MDKSLVNIYLQMTENLDNDNKLELISGLIESMKKEGKKGDASLLSLFGALDTEETAEELIVRIRLARNFNRKNVSFE